MTATLALAAEPQVIDRATDPEAFVVQACEQAKSLLQDALEHGEIEQIAELRSQAEAVRVYTVQKQLGHDAQLAAAEIVRRAERGIGLAIRVGQENGQIRRQGQGGGQPPRAARPRDDNKMSSPTDFATTGELCGNGAGIYHMTDSVSDEQFEQALGEAKTERDLSRANVVRKLRRPAGSKRHETKEPVPEPADRSPAAAQARRDLIAKLGEERFTSGQIAGRLGISHQRVREIARQHEIPIPADAVVRRTRRFDSTRIVRETADALEGMVMAVELADPADLDPADAAEWAAVIARSARVLSRFARQIKEVAQ